MTTINSTTPSLNYSNYSYRNDGSVAPNNVGHNNVSQKNVSNMAQVENESIPIKATVVSNNVKSNNKRELVYLKIRANQVEPPTAVQNTPSSVGTSESVETGAPQEFRDSPKYQIDDARNAYMKHQAVANNTNNSARRSFFYLDVKI